MQCNWKDCDLSFESIEAIVSHVNESHLEPMKGGNTCLWKGCDRFGQSFHNRFSLTSHLRKHTGDKPFVCTTCNKSFSRSDALSKHSKSHIDGLPSFKVEHKAFSGYLGPLDHLLKNLLLENMCLKRKINHNEALVKKESAEKYLVLEAIKKSLSEAK